MKTGVHLRRLLGLALSTARPKCFRPSPGPWNWRPTTRPLSRTCCWRSARRRQLPTPTLPTPQRRELIDDIELEPADPGLYDRFYIDIEGDSHVTT